MPSRNLGTHVVKYKVSPRDSHGTILMPSYFGRSGNGVSFWLAVLITLTVNLPRLGYKFGAVSGVHGYRQLYLALWNGRFNRRISAGAQYSY